MELSAGVSIGPYRLVQPAGQGGMAEVWRAYDTRLGRYVALKFLSPRLSSEPGYRERFQREALAVSRLDHPNILPIWDVGEQDGWTYMVSPYVGGGTLAERLGQPWSVVEAMRVLSPLASALDYAHTESIVHRDVKPSNVLFTERGRLLLGDFGIARVLEGTSMLTRAGLIVGTPQYMAPEQAEGEPVGPASDLYSLGVIAYEMLVGRPPFEGATPLAVLRAHAEKPLPPPRLVNPALPEEADAILTQALAKDPQDRFASGLAFMRALAFASGMGDLETLTLGQDGVLPEPHVTGQRDRRTRHRRRWLVAGAGAVALLIAAAAYMLVPRWQAGDIIGSAVTTPTARTEPTVAPGVIAAVPTDAAGPTTAVAPTLGPTTGPATAVATAPAATAVAPTVAPTTPPATPVPTATLSPPTATATPTEDQVMQAALSSIDAPWGRRDWDAVIARLAPLQARYPSNSQLKDKLYSAYVQKGQDLEAGERPVEARQPYEAADKLDPNRPEAHDRLQVLAPVKKALAWRIYHWRPGTAADTAQVRAQQEEDAYVVQTKPPAQWVGVPNSNVSVGPDVVAEASLRLLDQPGEAGMALFEGPNDPWADLELRIARAADGSMWASMDQANPRDQSQVLTLARLGPNPPFLAGPGQPNRLRVEIHGLAITGSINGGTVWSGRAGRGIGVVNLLVGPISVPSVSVGFLEYLAYEP